MQLGSCMVQVGRVAQAHARPRSAAADAASAARTRRSLSAHATHRDASPLHALSSCLSPAPPVAAPAVAGTFDNAAPPAEPLFSPTRFVGGVRRAISSRRRADRAAGRSVHEGAGCRERAGGLEALPPSWALSYAPSPSPLAASGSLLSAARPAELSHLKSECPATHAALWTFVQAEAAAEAHREPFLASFLYSSVLSHSSLPRCLASVLANKLACSTLPATQLLELFSSAYAADPALVAAAHADLQAVVDRDPACSAYLQAILFFKGFQALQCHRVAHALWSASRAPLALALQSRVSEAFHVDIHPGARIGPGLMLDHATGVVIGETAVVGSNCSFLHQVTLGGTGSAGGDRHPKVGNGVLVGAGVSILGPVRVGDGAKVGAGSVVLSDIPARCTAVGVPARVIARAEDKPGAPMKLIDAAYEMDQTQSFLGDWIYII